MKTETRVATVAKNVFPSRALILLLSIGFIDLMMTAVLHANGQIVELNPLMRPLIERSEWLFVFVKSFTIVAAWTALAWYAKQNIEFVRKVCLLSSALYLIIWSGWFLASA
jgi:hypothetical protein